MLESSVRKSGDNLIIGLSDMNGEVCSLMYYFYEDDLERGTVTRKNLICVPNKQRDIRIQYDSLDDELYMKVDVEVAQKDVAKLIEMLKEASELCNEVREVINRHFPK